MMSIKIEAGSVSHGTLQTRDLLSAFATELERIESDELCMIAAAQDRADAIENGADETESDSELVTELQDALDALAPAGMYFGNTEGDGSDFGWWLNEAGRRAAMATEFSAAFETRTRDSGESFVCLRDGSPDWMRDICHAAHGDMMPDDYRYQMIRNAADGIAEALADDPDADVDTGEMSDGMVSVYHAERFRWLASNLSRQHYCDEAREEGLVAEDASISDRVAAGWYREADEVAVIVWQELTNAAE